MKQYLYITLLLIYCWTGSAQNRVEAMYLNGCCNGLTWKEPTPIRYLKSKNGKYEFKFETKLISDGSTEQTWVLRNISINEIVFRSKPEYIKLTSDQYYCDGILSFGYLGLFKLKECENSSNKNCIAEAYYNFDINISYYKQDTFCGDPLIFNSTAIKNRNKNYNDNDVYGIGAIYYNQLFGIDSANIDWTNGTYNTNPEFTNSMVYQDRGDGWFAIPEYFRAKALLLTDEGDLQIVNTKEQVIWSLKQSQQDDKHFIAKGNTDPIQTASLVHTPEGHIELSNSKYQQEFDLTFLAKDYVLLSASNNKASELSVTSPNSMISMQVYQNSPTTSTAKSGLTSKSSTAKISPTEAPKPLVIPDQKNGITNVIKKTTKTAKTTKTVKIEKPMPTNTFTVFPNPVKDIINIVFDDTTETLTKLQILSLDGRIIREFTGSQTPNIQELSSGMYLYLIESTKNKYNGKIIKQ